MLVTAVSRTGHLTVLEHVVTVTHVSTHTFEVLQLIPTVGEGGVYVRQRVKTRIVDVKTFLCGYMAQD